MDKNQSIILMIIIVLIFVCIFLYFVFRPQTDQEEVISDDVESIVSISDINREDDARAGITIQEDPSKSVINESQSTTYTSSSNENSSSEMKSPETGPGTMAAVLAFIASIFFVGYWRYTASIAKRRSH